MDVLTSRRGRGKGSKQPGIAIWVGLDRFSLIRCKLHEVNPGLPWGAIPPTGRGRYMNTQKRHIIGSKLLISEISEDFLLVLFVRFLYKVSL